VEQSVLAHYLNSEMEKRHLTYFTNTFKHTNLYKVFVKNNPEGFKSAREFGENFIEVMKPNISTNKYYEEYKTKLDKEMQKFNGKTILGDATETNS
jgi:hypothetical protein